MRVKIWFELKTDHSPVRIEKEITLSRPDGKVLTEIRAIEAINYSISKLTVGSKWSRRRNLLRKDTEYYGQFGWNVPMKDLMPFWRAAHASHLVGVEGEAT